MTHSNRLKNNPPLRTWLKLAAYSIASATLLACATAEKPAPRASRPARPPVVQAPAPDPAQAAMAMEASGDYEGAAREYQHLAEAAAAPTRQDYQLRAAAALLKGNFLSQAKRIVDSLASAPLTPDQTIQRQLIDARIFLGQQQAQQALVALQTLQLVDVSPELLQQFYQVRADAYLQFGRPQLAAADLMLAGTHISDIDALRANQNRIWQILTTLPDEALRSLGTESTTEVAKGWVELAELARTYHAPGVNLEDTIKEWHVRYPLHPASEEIVQALLTLQREQAFRPTQIALILPQTGPVAPSAAAVRDGFLAAYYAREDDSYAPQLRLYDAGELPEQATAAYEQAVADGAQMVVGPLTKEAVTLLASREQLPVPTLALNYATVTERLPPNLFQFGLAPEDEARQVAERAWLDGHNQAIVLAQEGPRGARILSTFQENWLPLGGQIIETETFSSTETDFSSPLQKLLNIDDSYARHKQLKQLLRADLKFEPRRRADVDFVFIVAPPQQARQIRPQLKFYYATDLPIYSTSMVYGGIPDPAADADMDDIQFCDMPWTIASPPSPLWINVAQSWGEKSYPFKRLYALGVDGYNLIPHLRRLSSFRFQQYPGASGTLSLNEHNQMQRQLVWARFVKGTPRLLDTAALAPPRP